MMEYKNIIFDIDGTMLDSYKIYMNANKIAIKEVLNYELTIKEQEDLFHLTNLQIQKKVGCTDEEFKEICNRADEIILQSNVPLFKGILDIIKKLKNDKYFLAINTSRTMEEINSEKALEFIDNYFDFVVTSDKVKKPKPDREPTLLIIENNKLNKSQTIMIGDSVSDSLSAHNAGIKFALAGWGAIDKSVACDYYLSSVEEILNIIKRA